jgi:photosystem II stability/assembly factor-like uncharacterized protein
MVIKKGGNMKKKIFFTGLIGVIFILTIVWSNAAVIRLPQEKSDRESDIKDEYWQDEGPWGCDGVCLAVDPQNPGRLFLGTYGSGIYRTIDGGESWKQVNYGLGEEMPLWIKDMAVDPHHPELVYAVSQVPGGVWRSTDSGDTWEFIASAIPLTTAYCLVVDPASGFVYYGQAGMEWSRTHGLFKSGDNGQHWTPVESYGYRSATDIEIAPGLTHYTFYVSGDLVHRSNDGGQTWTQIGNGLPGTPRDIAMEPGNPKILYAGFHLHEQPQIYKTKDGGDYWFQYDAGHKGDYVVSIAIDPEDTNIVYAGGYHSVHGDFRNLYRSIDAGEWWELRNIGLEKGYIRDVLVDQDRCVYAACYYGNEYNGVYKSVDKGDSWKEKNLGITGIPISDIVADPLRPDVIYASGSHSGVYKRVSGSQWQGRLEGLKNLWVTSLAIDPHDANTIYAGANYNLQPEQGLFRSGDGAYSWEDISHLLPDTAYVQVTDVVHGAGEIYVAISGSTPYGQGQARIYKSVDQGTSWARLEGLSFSSLIASELKLALDPLDPEIVYACVSAGQGYGFYRSSDGGETWMRTWNNPANSHLGPIFGDLFEPDIVYIGVQSENPEFPAPSPVYKSTDRGENWFPMSEGLPPQLNWDYYNGEGITMDPETGCLYLGITHGPLPNSGAVYRLIGTGWEQVGDLAVPVSCLTVNGDDLFAGTFYHSLKRLNIR